VEQVCDVDILDEDPVIGEEHLPVNPTADTVP
jgi:hypothetical protein